MEPASWIIPRICPTVKMTPFLPIHSPHVRWGTPSTMVHLPKRPVCLAASVASLQKAAWNWRQPLITGDLKIPMLLTAPPCGVQRQVICFHSFLAWVLCAFWWVLAFLLLPMPQEKNFSKKEALPWKTKILRAFIWNKNFFRWPSHCPCVYQYKAVHNKRFINKFLSKWGKKSGGGMDPATIALLVYIKEFLVLQRRLVYFLHGLN